MHLEFSGWADPYDSCYTPRLMNGSNVVWQGTTFYGDEVSQVMNKVRAELQQVAVKYKLKNDFSADNIHQWGVKDSRTFTNS